MRTMKKSFAAIIAGSFLALIMCQAGYADSKHLLLPKGRLSPPRGKSVGIPSAARFFEKNDFVLLPLPFLFGEETKRYSSFLSVKERMVETAPMGNGYSGYSGMGSENSAIDRARRILDSTQRSSQEYMGICLNRGVDRAKKWKLSLDLGIALESNSHVFRYTGTSTDAAPAFQTDPGGQEMDFLEQIRNGAPFIGLGLSCRF
jgi:hypothetical protein